MMKNLMKLLTVISSLFVLQACSGVSNIVVTDHIYTKSLKELILQKDSMLARGYVKRVIPDEVVDEVMSYYDDKEDVLNAMYNGSYTLNDLKNFNMLFVLTERSFGKFESVMLFADKSLDFQQGDIIDFYSRQSVLEDVISRKPTIIVPYIQGFGSSYSVIIPNEPNSFRVKVPSTILGIVCRADDEGCDLNSTLATTIGYIRRLDSPADYRGVAIESLEPVLESTGTSLAEALVINACPTCDDEKDIKELKELGVIK